MISKILAVISIVSSSIYLFTRDSNESGEMGLESWEKFSIVEMRFSKEQEMVSLELYNSEPNNSFPLSIFEIESLKSLLVTGAQCCDPDSSCRNFVSLPDEISQLENLEELIWNNYSIHLPPSITQLRKLKKLDLSSNRFQDFPFIFQIQTLESLSLRYCYYDSTVLSIENISKLKNLEKLSIGGNLISDDYTNILRNEFPTIEIVD